MPELRPATHRTSSPAPPKLLSEPEWRQRLVDHQLRVDRAVADHVDRARRGIKHPVVDFLFEYYSIRPGQLRRWSPGLGVALAGSPPQRELVDLVAGPDGWIVDTSPLLNRPDGLAWIDRLLRNTAQRPAQFGCFGLHEWAMVHRSDRLRHPQLGLRLSDDEVAAVVEERGVRCTHFDAFRFFTPTGRQWNDKELTRDTQHLDDQPGCLHVAMDLYKWAGKLHPATSSELLLDCFDLALDVRWIDMRASPYDLSSLSDPDRPTHDERIRTTAPIMMETNAGRSAYVGLQREFSLRAAPLRHRIMAVCQTLSQPQ